MQAIAIAPRLKAFRETLDKQRLDAMFVMRESNVTYLSGYTNQEAFLFISGAIHEAANILITDSRYTEQAQAQCPDYQVLLYRNDNAALPRQIGELCGKYGVKRLGFERAHISFAQHEAIQKELPRVELCPVSDVVEELRLIKDEAEAERIRYACAGTDRVFKATCDMLRPGLTERELEWAMLCLVREYGYDPSFPFIVVSGARGSLPHGVPGDKKLETGEFVTMDFGCMYQGYHADMTRTVFLGDPTVEQRRIYDIVLEANLRAAATVRAGAIGRDADAAARDHIAEMGYGANFGHGLGHGLGLDIHERPFMGRTCMEELKEGCFVTVEPGIYIPGVCGVRIEDTVRVGSGGCEVLFESTKELICL